MRSPRFLLASLTALTVVAACDSGGGDDSPSRNTPTYEAVINFSNWFRWTPRSGSTSPIVPIEVDDVNLPSGLSAADARDIIVRARDVWRSSIREMVSFNTSTRFLSTDPPFSRPRLVLEVEFVENLGGSRVGQVIGSRTATQMISLQLQVAVNDPSGNRLGKDKLTAVAVHEFGHALGISNVPPGYGHSTNEGDCMFAEQKWGWTTLSTGDNGTVQLLYMRTPTVTRIDG